MSKEKVKRAPKRERDEKDDAYFTRCIAEEGSKPHGEWSLTNLQRKCKLLKLVYTYDTKEDLVKRIEDHESGRFSQFSRHAKVNADPKALVFIEPKPCVAFSTVAGAPATALNIPMEVWKEIFSYHFHPRDRTKLRLLLRWRVVCKYFHRILTAQLREYALRQFGVADLGLIALYVYNIPEKDLKPYKQIANENIVKVIFKKTDSKKAPEVFRFNGVGVSDAAKCFGSAEGIRQKLQLLRQCNENAALKREEKKWIKDTRTKELNGHLKKLGFAFSVQQLWTFSGDFDNICRFLADIDVFLRHMIDCYLEDRKAPTQEHLFSIMNEYLRPNTSLLIANFHNKTWHLFHDVPRRDTLFRELYETFKDDRTVTYEKMRSFFFEKIPMDIFVRL